MWGVLIVSFPNRPNVPRNVPQKLLSNDQINFSSRTCPSKISLPDLTIRNPSALRQALQHFDTTFYLTKQCSDPVFRGPQILSCHSNLAGVT